MAGNVTAAGLWHVMVEEFGITETLATLGWLFANMVAGLPPDPVELRRRGVGHSRYTRWKHLKRLERTAQLIRQDQTDVLETFWLAAQVPAT